jgi:hypothetical protein
VAGADGDEVILLEILALPKIVINLLYGQGASGTLRGEECGR